MDVSKMMWWEREKLLTEKDKSALLRAVNSNWEEIDVDSAETAAGQYELSSVISRKRHAEEFVAGIN